MGNPDQRSDGEATLRSLAEAKARQGAAARGSQEPLSPEAGQQMVHELQVHQIELELQNEELRRAQTELNAARDRYFDLYNLAPVGYCTLSKNGITLEANLTATTLLGLTRGALVKQPLSRFIHPDDQARYYLNRKRLLDTGNPLAWDLRLLKGDGTSFWGHLEASVAPGTEGEDVIRLVLSDATERVRVARAQAFLAKAEWLTSGESFFPALARFLADDLGMDYVCIDRLAGDCLEATTLAIWFDGHFEDNVSYTLKDTPCGDVVGKAICCFPSGVRHLFPKDQVLQDMVAESYLGVTLWGAAGQPIGLIALIGRHPVGDPDLAKTTLDLVSLRAAAELERHMAEAEKLALQAQLQQSQKMESLGTLAGGVAHDMNNVLGAILGLASAHIGNQPYGSPLHQALDTICKAAERGGKMVKSLLSFARQSPVESNQVDLNAILKEQISLLEQTTLAKVCLKIDLEPALRPIMGDASALTHALLNLCVNAVDAMPEDGTLTLHTRNVDNDWIEVVVEDNGAGMSKEVLAQAMDPFFTTKAVGKGTGLGLSMVYTTVKAHRGQIAIESEPDQGTRVRLRFPACEQEAPVQAAIMELIETTVIPHGAMQVLLIDDDELIQGSVRAILEVLGHTTVITAQSGEEALAMLGAGLEPDLVILDMNMPGLGGIGTLPRLRALRPEVPVLLSTGRVDQTVLTLATAHPGVTLLSKPFGLRELQKHLESIGLG